MILFDPDLRPDPDTGPRPPGAATPSTDRLPSARALTDFLRRAQAAVQLRGQVSVLLTTDLRIRRLNRQFRGKNQATDVLSFPAAPGPEKLAGDLAVSVTTARKQAAEHAHPLSLEIKVLILHGLLHLSGYDHETDNGEMARRERSLRARLKLPLGLIERARRPTHPTVRRSAAPMPAPASGRKTGKAPASTRKNAAGRSRRP
jgi:probable rRNA maturation factor